MSSPLTVGMSDPPGGHGTLLMETVDGENKRPDGTFAQLSKCFFYFFQGAACRSLGLQTAACKQQTEQK